jgi:lactate permease
MTWIQLYNPLGSAVFSALAAASPLLVLFVLLATRRVKSWLAALLSVLGAFMLATTLWGMPAGAAVSAAFYGIAFAVFPILWIVVAALWVYTLSVTSGQFEVIKATLARMTADRRLQALFIAFAFGSFLEGSAGFGTPVAITAAMLVGLGFDARYAAAICLVANSAPVAFAAAGVPVAVAAEVSGLDILTISSILGRQLPLLSLAVPLWLCVILCGWKKSMEVLPAILVAGISMAGTQFVLANFSGPFITGVASGLITTGALALFLWKWKPKSVWDFPGTPRKGADSGAERRVAPLQALRAWSPFLLMSLFVLLWGFGPIKALLGKASLSLIWPWLHNAVVRTEPIVTAASPYPAVFNLAIVSAPGTAIFAAGFLSAFILPNLGIRKTLSCLGSTLKTLRTSIATVCFVLATAYIMNYAGMSSTIGIALSATGALFPLFSPILGWLGVLMTGSDTSSNALFCSLQRTTAEQLGMNPSLMVASNCAGGVTGKMISPQSISVATASANLQGQEGWLFRFTIWHSVGMALLISIITLVMAYVVPGIVPR